MLGAVGFEVNEVESGEAALQLVREWRPDLILMDVRMPGMGGYEAMRRFRAQPDTRTIPIIALSASAYESDRVRAVGAGADLFVPKPISADELLERIGPLLGVEYLYEQPRQLSHAPRVSLRAMQRATARLSQGLVGQMNEATTRGDLDKLSELLERVRASDAQLAGALRELAEGFQYDELNHLLAERGVDPEQRKHVRSFLTSGEYLLSLGNLGQKVPPAKPPT
jgi:CheY-like chemotaxis protein